MSSTKIGASMRILKGKHAGRWLTSPARNVRPTPEEVRDRCLSMVEEELRGGRVLDLFAGTGALGLEALSRGAESVDFLESGRAALHALKANVAALRATKQCRIFKRDAVQWVQGLAAGTYRVAFVDPPYGSRKLDLVVERWRQVPFADVLVIEHDKEQTVAARGKRYDFAGPTRVTVLRARSRTRPTGSHLSDEGPRGSPGALARHPSQPQNARLTRTKRFRPGR
jgi:16S rRNA (guanine966-N2)-methyltransferase